MHTSDWVFVILLATHNAAIISNYIFLLLQSNGVGMVLLCLKKHQVTFKAFFLKMIIPGILWIRNGNDVRKQQYEEQCIQMFIWVIFQDWKTTTGKWCTCEGWAEVYCPFHNAGHHMTNKMVSITTPYLEILLSWDVTMCYWVNSSSHSEGPWFPSSTTLLWETQTLYSQTIFIKAG
jgi:hypothetical protein